MKRAWSIGAAGALVLSGGLVSAQPAQAATPPSYAVMLLQPGAGKDGSYAEGLNNAGDVVGTSIDEGVAAQHYSRSTLWKSRSGQPILLRDGETTATAMDIAASGAIVGNEYGTTGGSDAYWYSAGTTTPVPLDEQTVRFEEISETGVAVLMADRAYSATSATDVTPLPFPDGVELAVAQGISDDGHRIAGLGDDAPWDDTPGIPLVWTDGVPTALTAPSGAGKLMVTDVNDSGAAVGCVDLQNTNSAFLWSATGTPSQLPGLGSGAACPAAINNAGTVAGTSENAAGKDVATVWLEGVAHDLNTLAAKRSGYTMESISDINASGQVVGTARLADGTRRGFIATPSTSVTVYTTPGYHNLNGREWRTTCEPYSRTSRCRTDIWATNVQYVNGALAPVTGWTFNNLTYTPSAKALWAGNPLAEDGTWTTDGRNWSTECNTPATGGNGCRSYIESELISATPKSGGGYTYTTTKGWVFNNIVHFTH